MRALAWLLAVCLLLALTPGAAHAQEPTPPALASPSMTAGTVTAETQLYPSPNLTGPTQRLAPSTPLLGLLARTADGWVWVVTPMGLGWLSPDAPRTLTAPLDAVPILPRDTSAAPSPPPPPPTSTSPPVTPTLASTTPPATTTLVTGLMTPASGSANAGWLPLLIGGLVLVGLAGLLMAGLNYSSLRQRLRQETGQRLAAETQVRELTLHASEAILVVDLSGQILEATDPASQLTGQSTPVGQDLSAVFPANLGPLLEEALLMGRAQREGLSLVSDPTRLVSVEARIITRQGRQLARLLLRDVVKPEGDDVLTRRHDIALYDIAITISRSLDRDKVLGTALDRLLRLAGADAGAIFLRDGGTRLWAVQGLSVNFNRQVDQISDSTGLMGQIMHSATPWLLPHLPVSPDALSQALASEGVASLAVIPLLAHGEEAGVILLGSRRADAFAPRDVPLFEVIGAHIGVAVENARLFREVGENLRSLENVKRFSESVFQNMSNGVITLDAAGRVTSVNHAAEQMLHTPLAAATELPLEQVLGAPPSLMDMVQHVLRLGTTFAGHELVVNRLNAQAIPLRLSVAPLRDDKSLIIGAVLVFDDLTQQRTMEEERQRLDRLALLGEMTAVIAHELRNPLASISSGIQYLLQQSQPHEPSHEALALVLRESTRLNQLLEDILAMSRTPRIHLSEHDITEILDDVLARWAQTAAAHSIQIVKDYAPNTPPVPCDPLRIEQALSNLVMNGIQAMREGGVLTLRTYTETVGEHQNGSAEAYLVIEITDSGVGIPTAVLSKLFTPFFTTKGNGTGLGLTITQRIINEHGGEVNVWSAEGQGATFTIRLPISV